MSEITVKVVDYQTSAELIRAIRFAVFVHEQGVPEQLEMDGQDEAATHVLAWSGAQAVGTGRMLADGHLGRIAVLREFRNRGVGRLIMARLLETAAATGLPEVWLSSQRHACGFYRKLGFVEVGENYLEAGIEHQQMRHRFPRR